jgi:DNA-binding transcriptional LysR family regulator
MELRQLRSFVAVARHGNVTRAAQDLYLTQSALSQQLRRLEESAGVALLRRTPRGVELTAAGEDLLTYAEDVLRRVDEARAALDAHAGSSRGVARIAASPADAARLPAALASFHADHPEVRVALRHAPAGDVATLVRRGSADLGLTAHADPPPEDLDATPLAPEPLLLLTAPGAAPGPARVADLRDVPLVLPERGTALREAITTACAAEGFSPVPLFEIADPATTRFLAAAGLATGVAPPSWLDDAPAQQTLAAVGFADPAPVLRLALLSLPRPSSPAAALLRDHLRDALA